MTRAEWIKHALVFVAAIFMVWLSGVIPIIILKPGIYAGLGPFEILSGMGLPTIGGLITAWPIYIAIAICQALTFHYVKKWTTPIFLTGVFVLGVLFAWRYWTAMAA
jgi:hypothetical protein